MKPIIEFTKVRKVHTPDRAHDTDAGIDFFFPTDISAKEMYEKQINPGFCIWDVSEAGLIEGVTIPPQQRVLIPSGIRLLITPKDSMLMAANKSGIASKTGLVFGAQIIDSPYTGELHISLINTSNIPVTLCAGNKLVQFIHVPIILSTLKEITEKEYQSLAEGWGTRGSAGFGSTDETYEDEINLRQI